MPTLEDQFPDVLAKAQRGLALSDEALIARAGITGGELEGLRSGKWDADAGRSVAAALHLRPRALADLAEGRSVPPAIELEGLSSFSTPFGDMWVNSYLVWDAASGVAAAFDTGSDCTGMLDFLGENRLRLEAVFLTHTHGDHVFELDRLCAKTGAPAFVNEREPLEGARPFVAGKEWKLGGLRIESRWTHGHSAGGTTFVVGGLAAPVAVVGDALFASSMGGARVSYESALRTNLSEIYSLPDETVLCPGHGPLTTVGWEKRVNPFFVE